MSSLPADDTEFLSQLLSAKQRWQLIIKIVVRRKCKIKYILLKYLDAVAPEILMALEFLYLRVSEIEIWLEVGCRIGG